MGGQGAFEKVPPLGRGRHIASLCHSDSLPGLRSVMEGMESSGCDFSLVSDAANAAAASTIALRPGLLASGKSGIAGLKRSAIERKQIAQRFLAEWKA